MLKPTKLLEEVLYALFIVCITGIVYYGVVGILNDVVKWMNYIVNQSP